MDYKTILVHVAPGPAVAPPTPIAARLAKSFGAELVGIGAYAFEPDHDWRLSHLDGVQVAGIREDLQLDMQAAEAQFRGAARAAGVPCRWRMRLEDPDDTLIRHAGCADLIVAARPEGRVDRRASAETDDLILESGLPVLVLPPGQDTFEPEHVVIGWKNTREARRALGDALPFLTRARKVEIVTVCDAGDRGEAEAQLADVAARLYAHGVKAEVEAIAVSVTAPAEELLQLAQARGADLLVLGAYGHSRLREWVLGGVTQHMLAHAWSPVLFSR